MAKNKKRFVIGIDPGIHTGFAIYDRETKRLAPYGTMDFWQVYGLLGTREIVSPDNSIVIVETPRKTRLYARQDAEQGTRRREKIAANAGGNAREAELLAEGIEGLGFEVTRVTPSRSKWTPEQLKRYTGVTARTNQHIRDAIALCYGA